MPSREKHRELWADETTWSWRCIGQELVKWGMRRVLLDCFSTVVRANSPRVRDRRVARNPCFMSDAETNRRASRLLTP